MFPRVAEAKHCARRHGCEQSLARMRRRTRVQWWRWRMEPVVHGRKGESVSDGHCVRPRTEHVCRGAGWSSNRCAHHYHCSKKTSAHAKAAGQANAARGPGQQRGCMLFAHVCCIARAKIDNWKGCCRSRWSPCDVICCRCPRAAGPRLLCSDCSCARERHHLARHRVAALKRGRPTAWLLLSAKEWCPLSSELAGFGRKPCSCPIAAWSALVARTTHGSLLAPAYLGLLLGPNAQRSQKLVACQHGAAPV